MFKNLYNKFLDKHFDSIVALSILFAVLFACWVYVKLMMMTI